MAVNKRNHTKDDEAVHAKIMLLPASAPGEKLCGYAEQILTEVSAAFEHSFSLKREKIGEKSMAAYGEALTDETVDKCLECQGVFLCDAECQGARDLYDALNLPLRIRSFCVPESLCNRYEAPVTLWLSQALSIDSDTLRAAMHSAFAFAKEADTGISHVPPAGAARQEWESAIRVQEAQAANLPVSALSAPDAITTLITAPSRLGMLLCPPYAGGMMHAAATALCTHPEMMHDAAFDGEMGVYAPYIPPNHPSDADLSPFATALAVGALLRYSLHLFREAGCVEAAVNNVLSSGYCPMDPHAPVENQKSSQELVDLICEQIAVAGELMGKAGITNE